MGSRYFALVTGASRGFGKSVSKELVRRIGPQHSLDIVLVARNERGLESTATDIKAIAEGLGHARNVVVRQESVDLADFERLEHRLDGVFADVGERNGGKETWRKRERDDALVKEMCIHFPIFTYGDVIYLCYEDQEGGIEREQEIMTKTDTTQFVIKVCVLSHTYGHNAQGCGWLLGQFYVVRI